MSKTSIIDMLNKHFQDKTTNTAVDHDINEVEKRLTSISAFISKEVHTLKKHPKLDPEKIDYQVYTRDTLRETTTPWGEKEYTLVANCCLGGNKFREETMMVSIIATVKKDQINVNILLGNNMPTIIKNVVTEKGTLKAEAKRQIQETIAQQATLWCNQKAPKKLSL